MNETHFSIVMTGYNSKPWCESSIRTAIKQNYKNFHVYCVDAMTNDGTYDILMKLQKTFPETLTIIRNETRKYQVQNIFETIRDYVPESSVVVSLDLDDWLKHPDVLTTLNRVYSQRDTWMTYGTYEECPYKDVSNHYHAYPQTVVDQNSYRKHTWLGSHLRTWRKELFDHIPEEQLRSPSGEFYISACDQAFMLPMLEMSGNHARYISDILYIYNKNNSLSEDKCRPESQIEISKYIRSLPPFARLNKL